MVKILRKKTDKPTVFDEDSANINNWKAVFEEDTSWRYHDQGKSNYLDGFQSLSTNWAINIKARSAFFNVVSELIGIKGG